MNFLRVLSIKSWQPPNEAVTAKPKLRSINWLQFWLLLLTVAGIAVSSYLMWGYATPGASLACGASSGCETVKNSPFASFMGLPLPVMGLVTYGLLFILIVGQNRPAIKQRGWSPFISLAIFGFSLTGVLYSAYLTYLELFVIYAICRWCVASAIIMVAIFGLSILNLVKTNQSYLEG